VSASQAANSQETPSLQSRRVYDHPHLEVKILISTFTFPPNKDGVAEAAWSMACGFADGGHEVVVCTGYLPERVQEQPRQGIRVKSFKVKSGWRFSGESLEEKQRMQQFILDEQPDLILCHCWEIWSSVFAEEVFPQLPRTKRILISHGYTTHQWRPYPKPPWFGLGILLLSMLKVVQLPLTMRRYDRVVFLSHARNFARFFDHLVARLTRYRGIAVIPNGTDPDPATSDKEEFGRKHQLGNGVSFLCVANYGPRKNQELAIRSFHRAAIPGSTLILIGSEFNAYSDAMKALDKQLSGSAPDRKVLFLEKLDRSDTLTAFRACDVFLLTAKAETQPIAILEAMAASMPFISTNTGCVRELPGGVIADGERQIAQMMLQLAEDSSERSQLGNAGREAVMSCFSKEHVLRAQANLVAELFAQAPTGE
jgi:glycosyltransferase involved in cell wall biosynthesis